MLALGFLGIIKIQSQLFHYHARGKGVLGELYEFKSPLFYEFDLHSGQIQ